MEPLILLHVVKDLSEEKEDFKQLADSGAYCN